MGHPINCVGELGKLDSVFQLAKTLGQNVGKTEKCHDYFDLILSLVTCSAVRQHCR